MSMRERLKTQEDVLAPQVTDWRSMVDSPMIHTDHLPGEEVVEVLAPPGADATAQREAAPASA